MSDLSKNQGDKRLCPKCGKDNDVKAEYCWACYYDFIPDKSLKTSPEITKKENHPTISGNILASPKIIIQQQKETLEIISGWETANRYLMSGVGTSATGRVFEKKGDAGEKMVRHFTNTHRPYEITFLEQGIPFLAVVRKFKWLFSRVEVTDPKKGNIGIIQGKFNFFKKRYEIYNSYNQKVATIIGPLLHPWTFKVYNNLNQEVAVILKKWSGAVTEIISDADNFLVDISKVKDASLKPLILAAAIVIDIDYFERKK
ncbi:hypothetical protein KAI68_04170 [bacterium]|nr:hypothetical protein [bacterium]